MELHHHGFFTRGVTPLSFNRRAISICIEHPGAAVERTMEFFREVHIV